MAGPVGVGGHRMMKIASRQELRIQVYTNMINRQKYGLVDNNVHMASVATDRCIVSELEMRYSRT